MIVLGAIAALLVASRVQYDRRRRRETSLRMSSQGRIVTAASAAPATGFAIFGAWEVFILQGESLRLIGSLYALGAIGLTIGAHHLSIWWGNHK